MASTTRQAALDLLGVQEGATEKEIRQAWRALVRTYHPDQARDDPEAATRKMAEINAAFDALMSGEAGPEAKATKPTPQDQARRRAKQAADEARRAALRAKILAEKAADQARVSRLRKGVEKASPMAKVSAPISRESGRAARAFAEARDVFRNHPRAQIRSIFA